MTFMNNISGLLGSNANNLKIAIVLGIMAACLGMGMLYIYPALTSHDYYVRCEVDGATSDARIVLTDRLHGLENAVDARPDSQGIAAVTSDKECAAYEISFIGKPCHCINKQ